MGGIKKTSQGIFYRKKQDWSSNGQAIAADSGKAPPDGEKQRRNVESDKRSSHCGAQPKGSSAKALALRPKVANIDVRTQTINQTISIADMGP